VELQAATFAPSLAFNKTADACELKKKTKMVLKKK